MNFQDRICVIDASAFKKEINYLIREITTDFPDLSTDTIIANIRCYADDLPRQLKKRIYDFKYRESSHVLIFKNDISPYQIGRTPSEIKGTLEKSKMDEIEIFHALFSSTLGEIFTWSTIQNGNIVNDVFPIKENIDKPISSGTRNLFDLHTEDAFHPLMGEYLSLCCLKNPNKARTLLSSVDVSQIPKDFVATLFEERFFIGANIAHETHALPKKFPLLFGGLENPYLRINLNRVSVDDEDKKGQAALDLISSMLRSNIYKYCFEPGDIMLIDNFKVVHGRDVYEARYDGTDRWLKRYYLTNDLRKSRQFRLSQESRVVNVI